MSEERQEEAEGYFHRAFELHLNEEYAEAIQHYRRSIELHPTPEAHTYLGWSYSKINEYDRAIQECLKAIRLDADFGNPYNDIGAYLIQQGKIDEAIPWLEKALAARRYEGRCYPHMNLARIWEQKLHFGRAIEEYRCALMENPDYTPALVCLTKLQSMLN
ncbi:MAG: tetratricopeptide repeat protein [Armatimonadetes bacterium]|nr:tetratricopeptide repeat protein [Armatimonadota bacterium]